MTDRELNELFLKTISDPNVMKAVAEVASEYIRLVLEDGKERERLRDLFLKYTERTNETILLDVGEANTLHHMVGEAYSIGECLDRLGIPTKKAGSDGVERSLSLWGRVMAYGDMREDHGSDQRDLYV